MSTLLGLLKISNGKALLKLALFCLIESIKENPEKYSPLVYENLPQMTSYLIPYYAQPSYFDTKAMLVEEAEKMYNKLAKDLEDEILSGYTADTSRPSLPMFIPSDDPDEGAAEVQDTE